MTGVLPALKRIWKVRQVCFALEKQVTFLWERSIIKNYTRPEVVRRLQKCTCKISWRKRESESA